MFERWSERRRRWFLVTFSAVAWALFANSFAILGRDFAAGGVGPDAMHAAAVVGTVAMWTVIWAALHLRLRHWAFAALCGVTLSTALVEYGIRDLAAAATWDIECQSGRGEACRRLATYYEQGRSPLHGWTDAERLHARACALGVQGSCVEEKTVTVVGGICVDADGLNRDCRLGAMLSAQQGDTERMFEYLSASCTERSQIAACHALLNSGYPELRATACEVLTPHCRTSSSPTCAVTARRCERSASPHAGVR